MQLIDIGAKDSIYKRFESTIESFDSIHLFEPNPLFAEKLRSKYLHTLNVYIHEIAVSDTNTISKFNIAKLNAASSLLTPLEEVKERLNLKSYDTKKVINVQTATLENLALNNTISSVPTVMKLDTQGMELRIIKSGTEFIAQNVEIIITEADFHRRYKGGSNFEEVDKFIKNLGYTFIKFIDEVYLRENPEQIFFADALYIKNPSDKAVKLLSYL